MYIQESKDDATKINEIIEFLADQTSKHEQVHSMLLSGSYATETFDQYSDIDLKLIVSPGTTQAVARTLIDTLKSRFQVIDMMGINAPSALEIVLRFEGLSLFSVFDISIFEAPFTELNIDQHGTFRIIFDKNQAINQTRPSDDQIRSAALQRINSLERLSRLFSMQTEKEYRRGRVTDAWTYYKRNLNRMADAARAAFAPRRLCIREIRYISSDMPSEVAAEFHRFLFPQDMDQLISFDREVTARTLEYISFARMKLSGEHHA